MQPRLRFEENYSDYPICHQMVQIAKLPKDSRTKMSAMGQIQYVSGQLRVVAPPAQVHTDQWSGLYGQWLPPIDTERLRPHGPARRTVKRLSSRRPERERHRGSVTTILTTDRRHFAAFRPSTEKRSTSAVADGTDVEPEVGIEPTTYRLSGGGFEARSPSTSADAACLAGGSGCSVRNRLRFVS